MGSEPRIAPARARTIGSLAAAATIAIWLGGASPARADDAARHVLDPVAASKGTVKFEVSMLAGGQVAASTLQAQMHGGGRRTKRVPATRVETAVENDRLLVLKKARRSANEKLKVRMSPSSEAAQGPEGDPGPAAPPTTPSPPAPTAGTPTTPSPPAQTPATPPPTTEPCDALAGAQVTGACWRPYAETSPFNSPVDPAALAPNSAQIVSRVVGFNSAGPDKMAGGVADTPNDWSHPIYFSAPSDPVFEIHCTEQWGRCAIEGMQVAIPDEARPAGGSDAHLSVIDRVSGWEYDFWAVSSKPDGGGVLEVGWGGRTRIDGDGLDSPATAAHFGLAAGVIRPAELLSGEINHALFMAVRCTNGTSVYPAGPDTGRACSEIGLSNAGAPAMGQRFFLDMSDAEIAAQAVPEWQKTILTAMADYGMYVGDTGGGGWNVGFESGSSYTSFGHPDPWLSVASQLGVGTWRDPGLNRDLAIFDYRKAANWGERLRVAAPPA